MLRTINDKRRLTMYERYSTIYIEFIDVRSIIKTFLSIREKEKNCRLRDKNKKTLDIKILERI